MPTTLKSNRFSKKTMEKGTKHGFEGETIGVTRMTPQLNIRDKSIYLCWRSSYGKTCQ